MNQLIDAKNKFNNTTLKKIVNVYQLKYKDGNNSPGFGDYLKSCFFLLQLCKMLELDFDMNFKNHPISKYLITEYQETTDIGDYSNIEYPRWAEHIYIENNGLNSFINNLNNVQTQNCYLLTNGWPIVKIKQRGINIIRSKLIPNDVLNTNVNRFMQNLNLQPKNFTTIHIRCDDKIFNSNDNKVILEVFNKIKSIIIPFIVTNNTRCLILSNSNKLKNCIKTLNFNNICFKNSNIVHLGGDNDAYKTNINDDDALLDTLKDFFVMAKSKNILSLSTYGWGSCFSDMCSQIYSIPIVKYIV